MDPVDSNGSSLNDILLRIPTNGDVSMQSAGRPHPLQDIDRLFDLFGKTQRKD